MLEVEFIAVVVEIYQLQLYGCIKAVRQRCFDMEATIKRNN